MRWTEAGLAVALGFQNRWYYYDDWPARSSGRYPPLEQLKLVPHQTSRGKMRQGSSLPVFATIFVSLTVWSVQTDNFPVSQGIRPSWYVYGWPFCFATSGRGRFNISSFDTTSLILDLLASVLLIVCTWVAARHLSSHFPKFSIKQIIAITTGVAIVLFVASGAMNSLVEFLGFPLPHEGVSSMAGNTRRWQRFSPPTKLLLGVGLFSVGYAITLNIARWIGQRNNTSKSTDAGVSG